MAVGVWFCTKRIPTALHASPRCSVSITVTTVSYFRFCRRQLPRASLAGKPVCEQWYWLAWSRLRCSGGDVCCLQDLQCSFLSISTIDHSGLGLWPLCPRWAG